MAIRIQADRVVTLAYRLTDAEGRLIEDRTPENPFEYIQGHGQVVVPVERAVEGKTAGFRAEVSLSAGEAYGRYDSSLVAEIPRERFSAGGKIEVGMKFNTVGPGGKPIAVRVIEVDESTVTVDGNHPLAGVDLIFDLRVLDVREATGDEVETGQVSPPPLARDDSGSMH